MEAVDFVTPEYIIENASEACGDPEFSHGLVKGWYMTQERNLMDELGFKDCFPKITADFIFPKDTLQFKIPEGVYNISEMYLFGGDCFEITNSQKIWWKRNFNNLPTGKGYTALRKDNNTNFNSDPFIGIDPIMRLTSWMGMDLLYYNIQNGMIMFSSTCVNNNNTVVNNDKFRIVYSGLNGAIGEAFCVPRFFNKVSQDWIRYHYFSTMAVRFPRSGYENARDNAKDDLYDVRTGSWWAALAQSNKLMTVMKNDLIEYYHRPRI